MYDTLRAGRSSGTGANMLHNDIVMIRKRAVGYFLLQSNEFDKGFGRIGVHIEFRGNPFQTVFTVQK